MTLSYLSLKALTNFSRFALNIFAAASAFCFAASDLNFLLSSSSLDLDMLEERAREVLNFAGEDEFIVLDEVSEL